MANESICISVSMDHGDSYISLEKSSSFVAEYVHTIHFSFELQNHNYYLNSINRAVNIISEGMHNFTVIQASANKPQQHWQYMYILNPPKLLWH